ncbi:S41 family peptidase [Rubinisphaera margarita]|uniref:S41 family peptidase n=1 Tax=Rubinisphaera margarita TaxID=2909586 RepID=UPI001EE7BA1F|nr:S41 family peptidase [Rubinisphaera margarita]MCG6154245.1 S41 family peptidase [Rubinisphaera margarita]
MLNKFKTNWKKWEPKLRLMALSAVLAVGGMTSTGLAGELGKNYVADLSPEATQQRISYRVNDSKLQTFLRTTSDSQLRNLFMEVSNLIDERHVDPNTYEVRTRHALNHIAAALENPTFLKANNVKASEETLVRARAELRRMADETNVRTANEAAQAMSWSMYQLAGGIGINPTAVGMEFINGNIDSLDKYSAFNPNVQVSAPRADLKSREELVGIGVEMKQHDQGAVVVRPVQGSPAEKAGVQRGDIIRSINGEATESKSLQDIAGLIAGPAGTPVLLNVLRGERTEMIHVVRGKLVLESVSEARMLDEAGTGYIRIDQFADETAKQLDAALWKLHNAGMKNLVLDLRGNPGGLLNICVEMCDKFLPQGTIVQTKGRNYSDNTQQGAKFAQTWKVPLVVLVDENSASASEIFAAAIQDNGRGVIVGRQSYGKGTVQTHLPLRTVSGNLKLTTAKFFSPNGREMSGAGVTPDVIVEKTEVITSQDADIEKALELINSGKPQSIVNQINNKRLPNS